MDKLNLFIKIITSISLVVIALTLVSIALMMNSKQSYKFKKEFSKSKSWAGNYSKLEDCLREEAIYYKLNHQSFEVDVSTCRYR